jgi:predicted ATP-grasp superfamily ATP-dependent carboligase
MSTPHRILLAHSADWLGVSRLPALFSRAGARTTLIAHPRTMVAQSRLVDEHIPAPRDLAGLVDVLAGTLTVRSFDFVVLADDALVMAVADRASEPWAAHCLPVSPPALPLLSSKFAFLEAAKLANLPVPRSQTLPREAFLAAAGTFGYPLMVKRGEGSGGSGVRFAHGESAVEAALAEFDDPRLTMEEYVEGDVCATEVLYDHGRPLAWVAFEKRAQFPLPFGPSAVRCVRAVPGMAELVAGCGAITGFHGFVAICWIHQPATGRIALLEMNPRQGSGMHLSPGAGDTFAAALRALLDHDSDTHVAVPVAPGTLYRMFPQDLERAIAQGDAGGLIRALRTPDVPWDDHGLLRAHLRYLARERWYELKARYFGAAK